ncbi:MAG: T9SS type A sorting domain-containing protein [Bacteroidetes bacterium]|nr:T9SS type A sorting domain-containing protein [Bacteroidota bacterium]
MKLRLFSLLLLSVLFLPGQSQTYTGVGGIVHDYTKTTFILSVSGLAPPILDSTFGLEKVCLTINHSRVGDLTIVLVSPAGTEMILSMNNGGEGDNYTNTCFNDLAALSITEGTPPFTGTFRPQQNLGMANSGQVGNGVWKLIVADSEQGVSGTLTTWSLTFSNNPSPPFFTSSNLPIVIIDTHGQEIPDEPKILADFSIIDNPPGQPNHLTDPPAYDGYMMIEIRGSSSQLFPKKSYGFKTTDQTGLVEVDTSLLGMPPEHDWVLIANFSDKSLLRNALTYKLSIDMGQYATRTRFCELFINDDYQGVYFLGEKIKRDNDRVDISKLLPTSTSGDPVTGGYIFKIDKETGSGGGQGWISPYPPQVHSQGQFIKFLYEYPDAEDIVGPQNEYIQMYVDSFETALHGPYFQDPNLGFRKYAYPDTFIDFFIINEISKNVDGYRLSTFIHKDKYSKGGKIRMGPVWDFDITWWNADYCGGNDYSGWAYEFPCEWDYWQVPFWWFRLMEDTLYVQDLRCRWEELRETILSNTSIFEQIDSMVNYIYEGQERNFTKWLIMGTYVWPNPSPLAQTYEEEIEHLKQYINHRFDWLDENIPGECPFTSLPPGQRPVSEVEIFPNPSSGILTIRIPNLPARARIKATFFNTLGVKVGETPLLNSKETRIIATHLPQGLYFCDIQIDPNIRVTKKIIIKN